MIRADLPGQLGTIDAYKIWKLRRSPRVSSVGRGDSSTQSTVSVIETTGSPLVETPTGSLQASVRALYAVLGAVLLAYLASLMVRSVGSSTTWLDGWGVSSFELFVGVLVLAYARTSRVYGRFALVLGAGMCLWAVGDFAMTIETLGGATPPVVSAANVLWAGFYPGAYVAVMMLMRREVRTLTTANYLDGVMAAFAAAALFVAFAFGATERAAGGGATSVAVNLIYPMGDILLFVLIILGIALLPAAGRRRWYLMGAACLINTSGDICALFPGLGATRFGYASNAVAWPASLFLFSLAVWLVPHRPATELARIKPSFLLPTLAAGSALVVVLVAAVDHVDRGGLLLAAATLATAGVRFGLSLAEMRRLTEERHRQLETAARAEQESHETLQTAMRSLEDTAQAGNESRRALEQAMSDYAEFSAKVAAGAGQQSAALGQTATTVNEVRLVASNTAQKASEVADRARNSLEVSDEGARAVETIAEAMEQIRARVEEIAADILRLSMQTQQIGDITDTVKQLADRSKLLAFNASIEAARAGEHGKGFGVVADQVRTLSDQSKQATGQVETVLGDIQAATQAAVSASKEGTRVVEHGLQLTGRASEVIQSLADTIRQASHAAEEIAASAQQESASLDQIANSMNDVNEAADDLNSLAGQLAALTAS